VIKKHSLDVALDLRNGYDRNDLLDRLAHDPRLGFDRPDLDDLVKTPLEFTGAAGAQIATVVRRVQHVAAQHSGAAAYVPAPIL
jgi:adenylosuccinate lyase